MFFIKRFTFVKCLELLVGMGEPSLTLHSSSDEHIKLSLPARLLKQVCLFWQVSKTLVLSKTAFLGTGCY
jgi:hypothetical protein